MWYRLALAALLASWAVAAAAAPPSVVASVKPLHSLVAGVMEGVGAPELLVKGADSPHTFNLRPSDARVLQRAEVVFWVGDGLETFLQRALQALAAEARVIEIQAIEGLTMWPARAGGAWENDHNHVDHDHHGHSALDAHLWLDPVNAERIVDAVARALSEADPARGAIYAANAERMRKRLTALDAELQGLFAPLQGVPFIVFHDAYQYLERRYGLAAVGAVTVSPERPPSARRLAEIRARLKQAKVRCVFREPQFPSALVDTVVEGTGVRVGVLDPLGAGLPSGPELYERLLREAAEALRSCLE
jgi:zinc transport system substrate-binding protein